MAFRNQLPVHSFLFGANTFRLLDDFIFEIQTVTQILLEVALKSQNSLREAELLSSNPTATFATGEKCRASACTEKPFRQVAPTR